MFVEKYSEIVVALDTSPRCDVANVVAPSVSWIVGNLRGLGGLIALVVVVVLVLALMVLARSDQAAGIVRSIAYVFVALLIMSAVVAVIGTTGSACL